MVNYGVNTTGADDQGNRIKSGLTAATDYYYITNVNCTRGTGKIKDDHRNYDAYRLYTLVVTYNNIDANDPLRNERIDARSYIRYYDANGKLRVFYNEYDPIKPSYYGGCYCSYNYALNYAIPKS